MSQGLAEIERLENRKWTADQEMRAQLVGRLLAAMLGSNYDVSRVYDFKGVVNDAIDCADVLIDKLQPQ
jgi:hypothetical protein